MSKVEGGRGAIDHPPRLEASCNYFFFEASRVKRKTFFKADKVIASYQLVFFSKNISNTKKELKDSKFLVCYLPKFTKK